MKLKFLTSFFEKSKFLWTKVSLFSYWTTVIYPSQTIVKHNSLVIKLIYKKVLVWIKFALNKENENIKNAKKVNDLKTSKFKTILFNKYIDKTMLAIISFPKINEKSLKIFKYLHKTLVFEKFNDENHTITVA